MTNSLTDALNRLVTIEKELTAILEPPDNVNLDAVPYGFYTQESFPYWTNRVLSYRESSDSQEFYVYTYRIQMRFIRGFVTEGELGGIETRLYTDIPNISTYFAARIRLQNNTDSTPLFDIAPKGAYITEMFALPSLLSDGIGQSVIGAEFIIEIPLEVQTQQAY